MVNSTLLKALHGSYGASSCLIILLSSAIHISTNPTCTTGFLSRLPSSWSLSEAYPHLGQEAAMVEAWSTRRNGLPSLAHHIFAVIVVALPASPSFSWKDALSLGLIRPTLLCPLPCTCHAMLFTSLLYYTFLLADPRRILIATVCPLQVQSQASSVDKPLRLPALWNASGAMTVRWNQSDRGVGRSCGRQSRPVLVSARSTFH